MVIYQIEEYWLLIKLYNTQGDIYQLIDYVPIYFKNKCIG